MSARRDATQDDAGGGVYDLRAAAHLLVSSPMSWLEPAPQQQQQHLSPHPPAPQIRIVPFIISIMLAVSGVLVLMSNKPYEPEALQFLQLSNFVKRTEAPPPAAPQNHFAHHSGGQHTHHVTSGRERPAAATPQEGAAASTPQDGDEKGLLHTLHSWGEAGLGVLGGQHELEPDGARPDGVR